MSNSHFVVDRKVWLLLMLVAGTLLLGAITVAPHAGSVAAQGPKPRGPQVALGTGFTYQGQMKSGGAPVNGMCDIAFRLYDAASSGNQVGTAMTPTVTITNGVFTTPLDFGAGVFTGDARWLDMQVGCPMGSITFTALNPRQPLTATPYALFSAAPWVSSGGNLSYNAGNVGIGTSGPTDLLHVKTGQVNHQIEIESTAANDIFGFQINGTGAGGRDWRMEQGRSGAGQFNISDCSANCAQRIVIDSDGNVGIGTTSPLVRLTVQGADTNGNTVAFLVVNSNGSYGLKVRDDRIVGIGALGPSTTTHACYNGSYFFAGCNSAAEYVPTIDDGAGFVEAADLVSIAPSVNNPYDDEHSPFVVTKSAKACDDNLLGFIVNPESGADGKKLNDHYLPLAIYGYFPAKVTLENGAIKRGDAITSSSKPGYGMKATQACKIIGYALEDASADGTIQVFANHGESATTEVATLRTQVKSQADQIAVQQTQLATQQKQMDALSSRLDALEQTAKSGGATALASR